MEEEIIDIDLPPEDQLMAEEPPDQSSMRDKEPGAKEVPRDEGRSRQVPRSLDKTSRSAASRSSERSRDIKDALIEEVPIIGKKGESIRITPRLPSTDPGSPRVTPPKSLAGTTGSQEETPSRP
jgi:hypothetical protein